MNVLILGSGAREHTFAYMLDKSPKCSKIYVAPGNAGTSKIATNITANINDFEQVKNIVLQNQIDLVVVGPEDPLVNGIVDFFEQDPKLANTIIIGPSKKAAQLEGSKAFAKAFMQEFNIPTASYQSFTKNTLENAYDHIDKTLPPYVLKADGLAAGKGVLIVSDANQAKLELKKMLVDEKFGSASKTVVIEQFLDGIELSVFVATDGSNYILLPTAKDYKRIGEGNTGLNTGGMGAISPVPFANKAFMNKVEQRIVRPTIQGIKKRKMNYKGFVFIGLISVNNEPYVIEYNVRMGDPETEVVLPRIETDLISLFQAIYQEKLNTLSIECNSKAAATVMLVSGGYPENYEKDKTITGINNPSESLLFHAGTSVKENQIVTNGGRVIAVTSLENNWKAALRKSYKSIEKIHFEKMYYRKDIGFDL